MRLNFGFRIGFSGLPFNLWILLSPVVWAFKALEYSLDSLALTSFGVMDTTLEEVFLKVSEEDQSLENSDAGETMFLPCFQLGCCVIPD